MPEVWVQVGGIRKQKNDLILREVGTLIVGIQIVKMVITQAGDLSHIKVFVIDPKKTLETLQVVLENISTLYISLEEGEGSGGVHYTTY